MPRMALTLRSMSMTMCICFDGLGNGRSIEKYLLKKVDTDYIVFNYYDKDNADKFIASLDSDVKVIVMGHSFGGETAIEFSKEWSGLIDKVVLIDPRWASRKVLSFFDGVFGARDSNSFDMGHWSNENTVMNFYQRSFLSLPGYKVKGATNIKLKGKRHIKLPGHRDIIEYVEKIL